VLGVGWACAGFNLRRALLSYHRDTLKTEGLLIVIKSAEHCDFLIDPTVLREHISGTIDTVRCRWEWIHGLLTIGKLKYKQSEIAMKTKNKVVPKDRHFMCHTKHGCKSGL
jgi:hypothetical protein